MQDRVPYTGYLSPHLTTIRELHGGGANTRQIAEALYRLGARACSSDLNPKFKMSRAHHVANLRTMVLHVLQRCGLRARRRRILELRVVVENSNWD
jgi:hypothetical protein